jgi:hypothetical protein
LLLCHGIERDENQMEHIIILYKRMK